MRLESAGRSVTVNIASHTALETAIRARWQAGDGFALATVNLDHLVKIRTDPSFAEAYAAQTFVVADGNPIVWLSKLAGTPVDLLPGSELVVPLCRLAAAEGISVALVGSHEAALADAARVLETATPGLKIVYAHPPSRGFDPEGAEADRTLAEVDASGARLCFLALGAPKQEILAMRGCRLAPRTGFVSIGAGLDFLGGHQRRAPRWVRRIAMEWLWRLLLQPRRLFKRYALSFAILPGLAWRAWRQRR